MNDNVQIEIAIIPQVKLLYIKLCMIYWIFRNDDPTFEPQNENTVDVEMIDNDAWIIEY